MANKDKKPKDNSQVEDYTNTTTGNTVEFGNESTLKPSLVTPENGVEPLLTEDGEDRDPSDIRKPSETDLNSSELKEEAQEAKEDSKEGEPKKGTGSNRE